jgi:hypothetical protein
MFRHSEIQALLRQRRRTEEARKITHDDLDLNQVPANAETEDGELEDVTTVTNAEWPDQVTQRPLETEEPAKATAAGRKKKGQQQKKGNFKQRVKPDLRKRTWDKVERGLESLDYGEEDSSAMRPAAQQRRQISYDDM